MIGGAFRGLVWLGIGAVAVLAADERGLLTASSPVAAALERSGAVGPGAAQRGLAAATPVIRGGADARRAWLTTEHRGLTVNKVANRTDGSLLIELSFRQDSVAIGVDTSGLITASRNGTTIRVTSAEAFERLQQVLAGSEAAFAARVLLAEREATSDLQAGEMSLLSTAAFVASLSGDIDAPRRLATRFVEKHRGIYRLVRLRTCFDNYSSEASAAWNDMQSCMDEANQDDSMFQRAYRRVACNAIWLVRSESAWIEYIGCLGPGQLIPQ
jgi:hypothetical protein